MPECYSVKCKQNINAGTRDLLEIETMAWPAVPKEILNGYVLFSKSFYI